MTTLIYSEDYDLYCNVNYDLQYLHFGDNKRDQVNY